LLVEAVKKPRNELQAGPRQTRSKRYGDSPTT
jgi:hypothetical protein